jgi:hypothetical protein
VTGHFDIGTCLISALSGVLVAFQEIPGLEVADRVGMAGTAIMIVYWMLTNFSKRLDKLTEAIDRLSQRSNDKR